MLDIGEFNEDMELQMSETSTRALNSVYGFHNSGYKEFYLLETMPCSMLGVY
jgi:hypothetical protein